jgi:hypothetical protein
MELQTHLARHSMDFWLTTEDLPLPGNRVLLGRDGRLGATGQAAAQPLVTAHA